MSESKSLKQMVTEINNLLASYGKEAVQQTKMEKEGKIIGKIKYGFKPQYVFDAINEVIGPENWRYEAQNTNCLTHKPSLKPNFLFELMVNGC